MREKENSDDKSTDQKIDEFEKEAPGNIIDHIVDDGSIIATVWTYPEDELPERESKSFVNMYYHGDTEFEIKDNKTVKRPYRHNDLEYWIDEKF